MVKLSNVRVDRIIRRISSGDNGAPTVPPLTAEEIKLGGRLEDFVLVSALGDDGHAYQWTFSPDVTKADIQTSVKAWFNQSNKDALVAPMLTANDTPPPEQWDTAT